MTYIFTFTPITSIALKQIAHSTGFISPGMAGHCLRLGNHRPLRGCQCNQRLDNSRVAMYVISCAGIARMQMLLPTQVSVQAMFEKEETGYEDT